MTNENEPIGEAEGQAIDSALTDVVSEVDAATGDDTDHIDQATNSWGWLLASVVAGIVVLFAAKTVLTGFVIPLPDEYHQMVDVAANAESPPEADAMQKENQLANQSRFLFVMGAAMAITFGWAAGVICQRIIFGIVGALVGVGTAFLLGMFSASLTLNLGQEAAGNIANGDMYTIALHAVQWAIIGLPTAVAIGIGAGRPLSGIKVAGGVVLAAILGGVIYMMGGTLLDPGARISQTIPQFKSLTHYIWCFVPPVLLGLFLSRSKI